MRRAPATAIGGTTKRWRIGDIIGRLFPRAEPARRAAHRALLVPDHFDESFTTARLAIQTFPLQIGRMTVLVDACVGEHKPRPNLATWHARQDGGFLARLRLAGVAPEAVDIVFRTHLHADHAG